MKKLLTVKEIADKHRLDFLAQSDEDTVNCHMSLNHGFQTYGEWMQQEAKKLVDSQPF